MSTEAQGGLLDQAQTTPPPNGHDTVGPEPSASDGAESKARAMGWVPKEEFKGDPAKWRPADEFVKRGEEVVPILRSRVEKTEQRLHALQQEYEADRTNWEDTFKRMTRMNELALKRQREQLEADRNRRLVEAAALGDVDTVKKITSEKIPDEEPDERTEAAAPARQEQPKQKLNPTVQRAVNEWVDANPWYNEDPELHFAANGVSARLRRDKPGLTPDQHLEIVTKEIRRRYADKFGQSEASDSGDEREYSAPSVAGGGRVAASGPRRKTARDLPADARTAGEQFVKQGLFKSMEDYAKSYWEQD